MGLWQRLKQSLAPPTDEEKQAQARSLYELISKADKETSLEAALPQLEEFSRRVRAGFMGMNYDRDAAQSVIGKHAAQTVTKLHPQLANIERNRDTQKLVEALGQAVHNLSEITNGILDEEVATWYALKHIYHGKLQELAQEVMNQRSSTYQEVKDVVGRYEAITRSSFFSRPFGEVPLPSVLPDMGEMTPVSEHEVLYAPLLDEERAHVTTANKAIYMYARNWMLEMMDKAVDGLPASHLASEGFQTWMSNQTEWLESLNESLGWDAEDAYRDNKLAAIQTKREKRREDQPTIFVSDDVEALQAYDHVNEAQNTKNASEVVAHLTQFDQIARNSKQAQIYDPNTITNAIAQKVLEYTIENMPQTLGFTGKVASPQMMTALNIATEAVQTITVGIAERQAVIERAVGLVYERLRDSKAREINRNKDTHGQPRMAFTDEGLVEREPYNLFEAIEDYAQVTEMQQNVVDRAEDPEVLFESSGIHVEGERFPVLEVERAQIKHNTETGETDIKIAFGEVMGIATPTHKIVTESAEYDESGEQTKESAVFTKDFYKTANQIVYEAARDMIMEEMRNAFETVNPAQIIGNFFGEKFTKDATYLENLGARIGYNTEIVDETCLEIAEFRSQRERIMDDLRPQIASLYKGSVEALKDPSFTENSEEKLETFISLQSDYSVLLNLDEEAITAANQVAYKAARDVILGKMRKAFETVDPQNMLDDEFAVVFDADASYMENLAERLDYSGDNVNETLAQVTEYRGQLRRIMNEHGQEIEAQHDESFQMVYETATSAEELGTHLERLISLTNLYGTLLEIEVEDKHDNMQGYIAAARQTAEGLGIEVSAHVDKDGDNVFKIGDYITNIFAEAFQE